MVKPVHEGSTLGIHIVEDAQALQDAWTDASRFDAVVMAERFIKGPGGEWGAEDPAEGGPAGGERLGGWGEENMDRY